MTTASTVLIVATGIVDAVTAVMGTMEMKAGVATVAIDRRQSMCEMLGELGD